MIWNRLKNYFLAGLIAVLPLWITYLILRALFVLTASATRPFVKAIPLVASNPLLLDVVSFLGTIIFVILLGLLLTNVVGRRVFLRVETYVQRLPVLSWIYVSIRKLTALFYQDDRGSRFKRVVMIEYPKAGSYALGFLTTDAVDAMNRHANAELVNVFVPTTPNPTSGFLLMIPRTDVRFLDISTEDAVKLIVSAGISAPGGQ